MILMRRKVALFFCVWLVFCGQAAAVVTVNETVSSDTYQKLDLLRANGLIKTQIVGVRPYSREEIARLVQEANSNLDHIHGSKSFIKFINEILANLNQKFNSEINDYNKSDTKNFFIKPVESVNITYTATNESYRAVPVNNGLGSIRAKFNPLYFFQNGQDYIDGAQYFISTRNWAKLTPFASLSFSPRVQFEFPHIEAQDQDQFFIDELQANVGIKNIRLSVGRGQLLVGQSNYGGFILSNNVRGLDSLVLSNDHPFKFPWVFKYLGDQKLTAFFATVGPEYVHKNSLIAGYKWSIRPLDNWELGLSNVMQIGGEGAPNFGFHDFIGDYVGFAGTANDVANRVLGFDTRVRMSALKGVESYFEAFWDDKTFASMKRTLIDTAAYKFGIYVPSITRNGRLSATIETKFISELFYRHSQFPYGYTMNNEIIGDAWGPDSFGATLDLNYCLDSITNLQSGIGYISAGHDNYSSTGATIRKITDFNRENHYFAHLGVTKKFKSFEVSSHFSFDRVENASFLPVSNNNMMFNIGVSKQWN